MHANDVNLAELARILRALATRLEKAKGYVISTAGEKNCQTTVSRANKEVILSFCGTQPFLHFEKDGSPYNSPVGLWISGTGLRTSRQNSPVTPEEVAEWIAEYLLDDGGPSEKRGGA